MRSASLSGWMCAILVAASLTAIVACGQGAPDGTDKAGPVPASTAPSPPAPAQLDASAILTKADAAEVLGKAVRDPQVSGVGTAVSSCNYMTDDLSGLGCLIRDPGSEDAALALFDQALVQSRARSSVEPVPVMGLGDKAYWAGGSLNQLNILKGRYWVVITVFLGGRDSLELAERAGAKAVSRLP